MRLTRPQSEALKMLHLRHLLQAEERGTRPDTFLQLRRAVGYTVGLDGAVVLPFSGMWLCIETDGYCHS